MYDDLHHHDHDEAFDLARDDAQDDGEPDEAPAAAVTARTRLHAADQITKVYFKDGKVVVAFEHLRDRHSVETEDPPHPDFIAALTALNADVLNILELPPENAVRTYQVTAKHKGQRTSVQYHAMRTLRGSPQAHTVTTPLKWTGHKDTRQALDDDQIERLNLLFGEVRLFLDGKRAQSDLFEQADGADGAAAGFEGDGAAPEGEAPGAVSRPDPAVVRKIALDSLRGMLGKIPNPLSVSATLKHFAEAADRVRGWIVDGVHQAGILCELAEDLERDFDAWRNSPDFQGTDGAENGLTKSQRTKIEKMVVVLSDLTHDARESEAAALVEDVPEEAETPVLEAAAEAGDVTGAEA